MPNMIPSAPSDGPPRCAWFKLRNLSTSPRFTDKCKSNQRACVATRESVRPSIKRTPRCLARDAVATYTGVTNHTSKTGVANAKDGGVGSLLCLAATSRSSGPARWTVGRDDIALPNWFVTTGNQQIASHIFDNLVEMDANSIPQPGLAESWSPVDDRTWEFKLRRGVKFHDGTPFTADQILVTFDHAKQSRASARRLGGQTTREKETPRRSRPRCCRTR